MDYWTDVFSVLMDYQTIKLLDQWTDVLSIGLVDKSTSGLIDQWFNNN